MAPLKRPFIRLNTVVSHANGMRTCAWWGYHD